MPRAEDNLARRGFLAVAYLDGSSDPYPKGTRAIRDHEHCMFADGRPLQTMAHVRQNLVVAAHSPESVPDDTMWRFERRRDSWRNFRGRVNRP
ncbi:MAG: hypothetical protein K0S10_2481 [Rubrobacteraceae bacterium]|nr:hypothetical protein [Rubrobacteraceae bacterium]